MPVPSYPNIGGTWQAIDGSFYQIGQTGGSFTITEHPPLLGGAVSAQGQGTITGQNATMTINTIAGVVISGSMQIPSGAGPLTLTLREPIYGETVTVILYRTQ